MSDIQRYKDQFPTAAEGLDLKVPADAATFFGRLSPEFRWDVNGLRATLRWSMQDAPIVLPLSQVPGRLSQKLDQLIENKHLKPEKEPKKSEPKAKTAKAKPKTKSKSAPAKKDADSEK